METEVNRDRLQIIVEEVERRVESLRKQALALKEEKESILELLQDFQDGSAMNNIMSKGMQEDFEYNIERLVLRCLTVEISVSTPRNETQADSYAKASAIVNDLREKLSVSPMQHRDAVVSHLNACLPEPLSSSINLRFQEKVLGCTAEDQKYFKKQLEEMYVTNKQKSQTNGSETAFSDNKCQGDVSSNESVHENDKTEQNETLASYDTGEDRPNAVEENIHNTIEDSDNKTADENSLDNRLDRKDNVYS